MSITDILNLGVGPAADIATFTTFGLELKPSAEPCEMHSEGTFYLTALGSEARLAISHSTEGSMIDTHGSEGTFYTASVDSESRMAIKHDTEGVLCRQT